MAPPEAYPDSYQQQRNGEKYPFGMLKSHCLLSRSFQNFLHVVSDAPGDIGIGGHTILRVA